MKPAVWRIFQSGRWSYADQPSTRHQDKPAWQPLYASLIASDGREVLAAWMTRQGYATGHGDTIEDLLAELDWQIAQSWTRALVNGVEGEREACAKAVSDVLYGQDGCGKAIEAIRARGQG